MSVLLVSYDDIGNPVTPVLMYASTERLLFLCRGYLPSLVLKVDVCQFQNIFMDVEAAELRANNAQAETISPHSRL